MNYKNSFVFYVDWLDAIEQLPAENVKEFISILNHYIKTGEIKDCSVMSMLAFNFVKGGIDKDAQKWVETKKKRSEAGKKHTGNQYTNKSQQNGTNGTSVPTLEQNGTNGTVNVNVNVSSKEDNKETKSSLHSDLGKEKSAVPSTDVTTKQKISLEERVKKRKLREKEFYNELVPYVEVYGKEMIRDFYNYWTEPSKNKTIIKKDQQRTWDTARRLAVWNKRNKNETTQSYKSASEQAAKRNASYAQLIAQNLNDIAEGRGNYDTDADILAM